MNDLTKQLFDAPWHVARVSMVETEDCVGIASVGSSTDAHHIASLPELYEALMEAAYEHCYISCLVFIFACAEYAFETNMIENGCPRKNDGCEYCEGMKKLICELHDEMIPKRPRGNCWKSRSERVS